jgi:hypothetical protein
MRTRGPTTARVIRGADTPFFEELVGISESLGEGAAHTMEKSEVIKQTKLKLKVGKGDRRMAKVE